MAGGGKLLTALLIILTSARIAFSNLTPKTEIISTTTPTLEYMLNTSEPSPTKTVTSMPTLIPTTIPTQIPVSQENCIYSLKFISDITIPDGTIIEGNTEFTKTWLVKNTGNCDIYGAELAYWSGSRMGGERTSIPNTAVGKETEVIIEMRSPALRGNYLSVWMPIIEEGKDVIYLGDTLWVDIVVEGELKLDKFIAVFLDEQRLCAYIDGELRKCYSVSTGTAYHSTPIGEFEIWAKIDSQTMSGDGYYLENVEDVMYFYEDYSIHAA